MSYQLIFKILEMLWFVIPLAGVLVCIFFLPSSWRYILRSLCGVFLSWGVLLLFAIFVFNPLGIEVGNEIGMDSPEMKFDNNIVASTLLGGWMLPTIFAVFLFFILKALNKSLKNGRLKAAL